MNTLAINKKRMKVWSFTTLLAVVSAVALPQLFHLMGAISGTGTMLGSTFLPMHLPVILAALLGGPAVGVVAGALSPLISFAISGMPTLALLPFMIVELVGYGLVGGLLAKANMPVFVKLLLTQLAGRVARALAVLLAVYGLNSDAIQVASIWNMVTLALPGILLQWALIPLLLHRMEGLKKYYA